MSMLSCRALPLCPPRLAGGPGLWRFLCLSARSLLRWLLRVPVACACCSDSFGLLAGLGSGAPRVCWLARCCAARCACLLRVPRCLLPPGLLAGLGLGRFLCLLARSLSAALSARALAPACGLAPRCSSLPSAPFSLDPYSTYQCVRARLLAPPSERRSRNAPEVCGAGLCANMCWTPPLPNDGWPWFFRGYQRKLDASAPTIVGFRLRFSARDLDCGVAEPTQRRAAK